MEPTIPALKPDALTTLEEVRDYLEIEEADTGKNTLLVRLINRASRVIRSHTKRRFTLPQTEPQLRYIQADGRNLYLDDPVTEILEITNEEDASLEFVAPDYDDPEYQRRPVLRLKRPYFGPVEMQGKWGFAEIPEDVEHAAVVAAAIWFRRDVANFTTTFDLDEQRVERPEALPSACKGMLAPWIRKGAVG